jgi:hypothetical protein
MLISTGNLSAPGPLASLRFLSVLLFNLKNSKVLLKSESS